MLTELITSSGDALGIQLLGAGQVLGYSWLIPAYTWTFQARAQQDTELLRFDGTAVLAHCEEDSAFGYPIMKKFSILMAERLEAARGRMMEEWRPPGAFVDSY